jgi:hypothetical protein
MNSEDSSVDKLKSIIELHVHITSNNQSGMASLNSDWMHLNDKLEYYLKLRKDYEENFRCILKKGIEDGELFDSNSEVMLFSILSTLRSLYVWIPKKEHLPEKSLADDLGNVLLNGIVK